MHINTNRTNQGVENPRNFHCQPGKSNKVFNMTSFRLPSTSLKQYYLIFIDIYGFSVTATALVLFFPLFFVNQATLVASFETLACFQALTIEAEPYWKNWVSDGCGGSWKWVLKTSGVNPTGLYVSYLYIHVHRFMHLSQRSLSYLIWSNSIFIHVRSVLSFLRWYSDSVSL